MLIGCEWKYARVAAVGNVTAVATITVMIMIIALSS
jgi:hypothetical protein